MVKHFITRSASQTKKLGRELAKKLKVGVLALEGELGSGKTTFLQGFAKGLGIREKIPSPTFIIIRRFNNFYHIDCYRLKSPKELLTLGFKNIVENPKNIVALEWADRVRKILPKSEVKIKFAFVDKNTRKIIVNMSKKVI